RAHRAGHRGQPRCRAADGGEPLARLQRRDGPVPRPGQRGGHPAGDALCVHAVLRRRAAARRVRGPGARRAPGVLGGRCRGHHPRRRRARRAPVRSQRRAALRPPAVPGRCAVPAERPVPGPDVTAARSALVAAGVVAVAAAPWAIGEGVLRLLSEMLLMLAMAQMWDLLAGYAGLVSMGQQGFIGLGAYSLYLTSISLAVAPCWVLPGAPCFCALVAAVVALFLFRLREAYFAIGTWVFSEVVSLIVSKIERLGGERGMGLPTARLVDARWLEPLTFWISAAIAVGAVAGT